MLDLTKEGALEWFNAQLNLLTETLRQGRNVIYLSFPSKISQ